MTCWLSMWLVAMRRNGVCLSIYNSEMRTTRLVVYAVRIFICSLVSTHYDTRNTKPLGCIFIQTHATHNNGLSVWCILLPGLWFCVGVDEWQVLLYLKQD